MYILSDLDKPIIIVENLHQIKGPVCICIYQSIVFDYAAAMCFYKKSILKQHININSAAPLVWRKYGQRYYEPKGKKRNGKGTD